MTSVFIDVETTGLDPITCSIWQIAGVIKKGDSEEKFDIKMRPYHGESITKYASEKTGMTDEILATFPNQQEGFDYFRSLLDKYININDWNDKAYFIGYNSSFDSDFVREWFKYNNYDKYSYYFWFPYIDVMALAAYALIGERKNLRNFQLSTVYTYMTGKILDNAHNAFADITATEELLNVVTSKLSSLFAPKVEPLVEIPVRKLPLNN